MGDEGPPEGVCGYEFDPEWLDEEIKQQSCCVRETLADTDQCVWHVKLSETDEKTVEALKRSRTIPNEPELFDGANLSLMELGDEISFMGSSFRNAELVSINLSNAVLYRADFANAKLVGAELSDAFLIGANFSDTDLRGVNLADSAIMGIDLSGESLPSSNLSDANLTEADISNASLFNSDLIDTTLRDADLSGSSLEESNLTRANLMGADLRGAKLHGSLLKDIQMDRNTKFGDHYAEDLDGGTTEDFDKAAWSLRQIQRLFEENAFPKKAREAKIERIDLRRRENWAKAPIPSPVRSVVAAEKRAVGRLKRGAKSLVSGPDEEDEEDGEDTTKIDRPLEVNEKGGFSALVSWSRLALSGFISRYAESPRRVVGVSLLTIVAFGFAYPFFGGMETSASSGTQYAFYTTTFTLPGWAEELFYNLYFSAVTFTTLGYGDIQPATPATQTLASVQSFLGALLMALLVYVFGRQSTR